MSKTNQRRVADDAIHVVVCASPYGSSSEANAHAAAGNARKAARWWDSEGRDSGADCGPHRVVTFAPTKEQP
jgi:hypothetical protein